MTTIHTIHDLGRIQRDHPDHRFESVERLLDSIDRWLEALEMGVARSNRDLAWLNDKFTGWSVVDNAALIASDMGLVWQKSLDRQEVVALVDEAVRNGKAAGIPTNHLRVLRRADLIIEATDEQSQTAYIVAEISWTAAERDTERAIRNAGYVALFTGRTHVCGGGKRAHRQGGRGHADPGCAAAPWISSLREGVSRFGG